MKICECSYCGRIKKISKTLMKFCPKCVRIVLPLKLKAMKGIKKVDLLLADGFPFAIWVKEWSVRFDIQEEGTKVGYANGSGWFFYAEGKDEFIEQYLRLSNEGIINPCG